MFAVGCRADSECPPTLACINRECIDPCQQTYCGTNAECRADYNHRARCYCLPGYRGNPLVSCDRPECTVNQDCPYNLACINEKCRDPCNCAEGAQCRVDNHIATCKCPPGYDGDAHIKCSLSKSQKQKSIHCWMISYLYDLISNSSIFSSCCACHTTMYNGCGLPEQIGMFQQRLQESVLWNKALRCPCHLLSSRFTTIAYNGLPMWARLHWRCRCRMQIR